MTVTLAKTSTTSGIVFALDVSDPAAASVRTGLLRSTWHKAINLSKADRGVFAALIKGDTVPVEDVQRAIVAGLATSVTRWGQSMTRRAGSAPLLALYDLLPTLPGVLPQVEVRKSVQTRVEYSGGPRLAEAERALQHQAAVNQTLTSDLTATRTTISTQQREIAALREALARAEYRAAKAEKQAEALPEPVQADLAALAFARDYILTRDENARISDFRTGYRAGRNA